MNGSKRKNEARREPSEADTGKLCDVEKYQSLIIQEARMIRNEMSLKMAYQYLLHLMK